MPRKPRFRNTGNSRGIKESLDPDTLAHLYREERLTQTQIARTYGCTPQYVSLLLHEYGIERRPTRGEQ
jgi:hypothetical protein